MTAQKNTVLIAIWISLISNIFLTIMKILIGLIFNSQVLVADGLHNAGDVIASIAALGSMMVSKKPADEDHPYGHGKAEVIASGVVAVILALAGILMAYKSVEALFELATEVSYIALIAAGTSLVWKWVLYIYCIRLGKTENSKSLLATAYDHLADVYASLAAVVGIGVAIVGQQFNLPYTMYGDPIAGLIVTFFVLKLSFHMGREAIGVLMEQNIPLDELDQMTQLVLNVPEVKRLDRIRAREHGHYIVVDIRVSVPGQMTIQEGHDIARRIKQSIRDHNDLVEEVLVHINPWYEK